MQWDHRSDAFADVSGHTLSRNGTVFQPDHVLIEITVIEFCTQRADTGVDLVVTDQRLLELELFHSKRESTTIIVSVRSSSRSKKPHVFLRAKMCRHSFAR